EPLLDPRRGQAEASAPAHLDGDEVAFFGFMGCAGRDGELTTEAFLVDRGQPAAAVRQLAEDAEHAVLGATDDLDGAALVENAVLGVARSFGAQESPVADPRYFALARTTRHMEPYPGRLAVGFLIPFNRHSDEFAVGVATGDIGEHDIGQRARAV